MSATVACDCGEETPREGAAALGWRLVMGEAWMCPPCVDQFRAWLVEGEDGE